MEKQIYYNENLVKKFYKIDNPRKDVSYLDEYFENSFDDFIENGSFEDIFIFLKKNKEKIDFQKLNMDFNFYLQKNFFNEIDIKKMKLISDFLEENYSWFNHFTVENYLNHKTSFELNTLKTDVAERNFNISFEYFLENTKLEEIENFLKNWNYDLHNLKFEIDSYIFNKKIFLNQEKNPEVETKIIFILKFLEEKIPGYRWYRNYLNNF